MALTPADALIAELFRNGALLDNTLAQDMPAEERTEAIEAVKHAGLVEDNNGRWKLTDKGIRRAQDLTDEE